MADKQIYYFRKKGIDAEAALQQFAALPLPAQADRNARVGLFYTPTACRLCAIDDSGTPKIQRGDKVPLDNTYEFRAFQSNFELRWLKEPGQEPVAVILGESQPVELDVAGKDESASGEKWTKEPCSYIEPLDQQYLLWGAAAQNQPHDHWTRLEEARIVGLDVPIAKVETRQRVELHFREYLANVDDDGNVVVIDQRFCGFQRGPKAKKDDKNG